MKIKFAFLVEIEVEDMETEGPPSDDWHGYRPKRRDAMAYVKEAVEGWSGQFYPTDPFFPTNIKVKVR